jgi:hypothetical protein
MVMFEALDNFRVEAISKPLAAAPHPDPCFQIPWAFDNERPLGRDGPHGPNVERAKSQLLQGRDCAFLAAFFEIFPSSMRKKPSFRLKSMRPEGAGSEPFLAVEF